MAIFIGIGIFVFIICVSIYVAIGSMRTRGGGEKIGSIGSNYSGFMGGGCVGCGGGE